MQTTSPHDALADRVMTVARFLPLGPFSTQRFIDHATGLNAISNVSEVDVILAHLADAGLIVKVSADSPLWIAA
jgi:hypothetical protein